MVKEKPNSTRIYDKDGFRQRAACICVRSPEEDEVRCAFILHYFVLMNDFMSFEEVKANSIIANCTNFDLNKAIAGGRRCALCCQPEWKKCSKEGF